MTSYELFVKYSGLFLNLLWPLIGIALIIFMAVSHYRDMKQHRKRMDKLNRDFDAWRARVGIIEEPTPKPKLTVIHMDKKDV